MQALKNNYEKFILGILLVVFVGSGVYWITYLKHVKNVASQGAIIGDSTQIKPLAGLSDDEFQGIQYLQSPSVTWGKPGKKAGLFTGRGYKLCADETCQHWIAFKQTTCPWCGTAQPPPKSDEPELLEGQDQDKDGIADDIENKFPFLRPDRPEDAWGDEDNDGFFNVEEFVYFRNLNENSDGSSMVDPKIHPPLATRLRLVGVDRDLFSIRLKKVLVAKGQEKDQWEIHLSVRDEFGRIRTRFASLGKVINGYKIADVEMKEQKYYNQSVNDYMTRRLSVITLEKDGEKPLRLKTGEQKYTGVVGKLVLDHPATGQVKSLRPVRDGDTLRLEDSAGQTETYLVSGIGEQKLTVTRLVNGQPGAAYSVGRDKKMIVPPSIQMGREPTGEIPSTWDETLN